MGSWHSDIALCLTSHDMAKAQMYAWVLSHVSQVAPIIMHRDGLRLGAESAFYLHHAGFLSLVRSATFSATVSLGASASPAKKLL